MKILVTGFKPFLGHQINPSEKLAAQLAQFFLEVDSLILPVEFKNAFLILQKHLLENNYDYLVLLGQAAGRDKVCLERFAMNWVETSYQDEAGVAPIRGEIIAQAPLALKSTFPLDLVYAELKKQTDLCKISFSAGTYVCNELYYRALNEFDNLPTVFVHVPLLPEQKPVGEHLHSFMSFDDQLATLKLLVKEIIGANKN